MASWLFIVLLICIPLHLQTYFIHHSLTPQPGAGVVKVEKVGEACLALQVPCLKVFLTRSLSI